MVVIGVPPAFCVLSLLCPLCATKDEFTPAQMEQAQEQPGRAKSHCSSTDVLGFWEAAVVGAAMSGGTSFWELDSPSSQNQENVPLKSLTQFEDKMGIDH